MFAHTKHSKSRFLPDTGRTPCGSATAWPLAVKRPAAAPFDALPPPNVRTELRGFREIPKRALLMGEPARKYTNIQKPLETYRNHGFCG